MDADRPQRRGRTGSTLPLLSEAQQAIHTARRQPARRIAAYTVLAAFLSVFLILGFATTSSGKDWANLQLGGLKGEGFPDFQRLTGDNGVRTMSLKEFNDGHKKRYVIVGDIHGMHGSFTKLMSTLSYNPSKDHLIHVGDLVAKGPHTPAVLKEMSSANVTGVRGNHDQKMIEWAAWIEWVLSHKGGQDWLEDMEKKTPEELEIMKKKHGKKWKVPEDWEFGGEHYWLARHLSHKEDKYMSSLPLIIHIPAHSIFLVHAGLLPLNPTIPLNSRHQPLSHVPGSLRAPHKKGRKIESAKMRRAVIEEEEEEDELKHHSRKAKNAAELRALQERMVLQTIPQNTVPFNLLNMRSVEHNAPVRGKKGRPWSDIWNSVISKCKGFPDDAVKVALTGEGLPSKGGDGKPREPTWWESLVADPGEIIDWDPEEDHEEHTWTRIPKKLPCNPSTVIYGHAAGRGLDVKKYSFGLDSGCVYGRRMTAMVLSDVESDLGVDGIATPSGEDEEPEVEVRKITIGDGKLHARLVSVRCPDVGA